MIQQHESQPRSQMTGWFQAYEMPSFPILYLHMPTVIVKLVFLEGAEPEITVTSKTLQLI